MSDLFVKDNIKDELLIDKDTKLNYYIKNTAEFNLDVEITKGAKLDLYIVILTDTKTDITLNVNHTKGTSSNVILKGVTKDAGAISSEINSAADKFATDVCINQQTKILAINNIKSKIKPNLLIANREVIANHGVSIGNINTDSMYYLMSKGIDKETAKEMLINGFLLGENPKEEIIKFFKEE